MYAFREKAEQVVVQPYLSDLAASLAGGEVARFADAGDFGRNAGPRRGWIGSAHSPSSCAGGVSDLTSAPSKLAAGQAPDSPDVPLLGRELN